MLKKEKSLLFVYTVFMFVFPDHLFAVFVHKNCVEFARLYPWLILELPDTHPRLNKKFANEGMYVVSRSSRFWAGRGFDPAIKQTVMRTLKR